MENAQSHSTHLNKVTVGGLLIAFGIVFGDIGTSPLYVFSAIVGERTIDPVLILGGLSAVFWTLMFQTTIKYVIIALSADNNGEGGVFSLYALIQKNAGKWLLYPAIIGGSFLLADGVITPPISVSSAIEGLRIYEPHIPTIPIVIGILVLLFRRAAIRHADYRAIFRTRNARLVHVHRRDRRAVSERKLHGFIGDKSGLGLSFSGRIPGRLLAARRGFSLHDRRRSALFGYGTLRAQQHSV